MAKRGKPKYLGGVGTKITGITRRKFRPNLQRVRVTHRRRCRQATAGLHPVHSQWGGGKELMPQSPFRLPPLDPAEKAALEALAAKEERKRKRKKS